MYCGSDQSWQVVEFGLGSEAYFNYIDCYVFNSMEINNKVRIVLKYWHLNLRLFW